MRFLRSILALALPVLLAACALVAPGPRTVSVSEARLAELLARQFPFNSRLLEVFDVTLSAPQLRLQPADNRIGTRFQYALGGVLLGSRRYDGQLQLSYGLRFEPSDTSVRLTDVRVEEFDVPGVPPAFAPQARRLGALLAEQLLRDYAIHHFKPEEVPAGYRPGPVRVVPGALEIELLPQASR